MTRPKDPTIRAQLLEKAVAHVLERGLSDLSLRPLAEAIGTSARMLIHHFGSKEALLDAILTVIEERYLALLASGSENGDPVTNLEHFWKTLTSGQVDHAVRLIFEVWGQALERPEGFESFLSSLVGPWVAQLEAGLDRYGIPKAKRKTLSTLIVSTFFGLLLTRLTTGDGKQADAAFRQFSRWLRAELEATRRQV